MLRLVYTTCLVLAPVLVPLFHCNVKSGQPCKGVDYSVGSKMGVMRAHATKMPTQYILARECMQVQWDGTIADVKTLPSFTSNQSVACFNDVLQDVLEGNVNLQVVVVRPNEEDLEHLFVRTPLRRMVVKSRWLANKEDTPSCILALLNGVESNRPNVFSMWIPSALRGRIEPKL